LSSDYDVVAEYFRAARKWLLVYTTHFNVGGCCKKASESGESDWLKRRMIRKERRGRKEGRDK
jgi:hypothetical protein